MRGAPSTLGLSGSTPTQLSGFVCHRYRTTVRVLSQKGVRLPVLPPILHLSVVRSLQITQETPEAARAEVAAAAA